MPAFFKQPVSAACCADPCDRSSPCDDCDDCDCPGSCCPVSGESILPEVLLSRNGGFSEHYYYNLEFDASGDPPVCRFYGNSGGFEVYIQYDEGFGLGWMAESDWVTGKMYKLPILSCGASFAPHVYLLEDGNNWDNYVFINFDP